MVQGLLGVFPLFAEGVALILSGAEALLRVPDKATRDALIRDKISNGNWQSHIGRVARRCLYNAATRGALYRRLITSITKPIFRAR